MRVTSLRKGARTILGLFIHIAQFTSRRYIFIYASQKDHFPEHLPIPRIFALKSLWQFNG